jgi:pilus assembly protein Flp/PilA
VEWSELMRRFLNRFLGDASGATAIEYGLIAGLVALVVVAAATQLFTKSGMTFNNIANVVK